jgi:hypothetical protein
MNSKQLHDLTAPLFAKHPSAKPDIMPGNLIPDEDAPQEYVDAAALIIQGHLVQWLAENTPSHCFIVVSPAPNINPIYTYWGCGGKASETDSLLKSLVAACMEVPQ